MTKKVIFGLLVITLIAMPLLAVAGDPAPAPKPITIKALTPFPKTVMNNEPIPLYVNAVKKRSQGRLIINWLGGPEVVKGFDQPEQLRTGGIDMLLWIPFPYMKPLVPCAEAQGLSPYSAWQEREIGVFDIWSEILQKNVNAKYLGRLYSMISYPIYTIKPVRKIDDFRGLRIRAMPLYIPLVKALGASPISMPVPEIYTALERGVVDGFMFVDWGITGWGWQEVIKYKIYPPVFQINTATLVNTDVWNKLPKDLQDLLMDVTADMEYIITARSLQLMRDEWEVCSKAGVSIITLPPDDAKKFREIAYDTTWKEVIKKAPKYGPKLKKLLTKK